MTNCFAFFILTVYYILENVRSILVQVDGYSWQPIPQIQQVRIVGVGGCGRARVCAVGTSFDDRCHPSISAGPLVSVSLCAQPSTARCL